MRFQSRQLIAAVSAFSLTASSAIPAFAAPVAPMEWFEKTGGQESRGWPNDGYGADHGSGPNDPIGSGIGKGSTAAGKYQIIIENWQNLGYVEPGADDWDQAVFTDKAQSMGVSSYQDLLDSPAGRVVQDQAAVDLANSMWNELSSTAKSGVGGQINETGLLGGAWFLGPGAMNTWAEGGFTQESLMNIGNLEAALRSNGFLPEDFSELSPEEQQAALSAGAGQMQNYLMNRMEEFEGTDISAIIDGTYVPGSGDAMEFLVQCDPAIAEALQQKSQDYVQGVRAAAQDDAMGFSQLQQPFGEMSCIDFAFTGGMDVLFSVPSLSDLAQQAMEMACGQVNGMISEQTGQVTDAMQMVAGEADAIGPSMGPLGNFGSINTAYNPRSAGINVGLNDGNTGSYNTGASYGGISSEGGSSSINQPSEGGFDALFVQQ